MNTIKMGCKLVALLILLSFLIYGLKIIYNSLEVISQWWNSSKWWAIYLLVITSLFLFLNLITIYGLLYIKKWGFIFAYVAIMFSTFFFSFTYIPLVGNVINNVFSIEHRYI